MSIIPCTNNCIYQIDGCCRLEKAGSSGGYEQTIRCLHYVPKRRETSG